MKEMKESKEVKRMSAPKAYPVNKAGIYSGGKGMDTPKVYSVNRIIFVTLQFKIR
jgi:hypothetical protein